MKKMFKVLLIFLFALVLSFKVYAEESADTGKDTQPVEDSQVEKQKKATENSSFFLPRTRIELARDLTPEGF